jgi:putative ABC transport system permease protein
VSAVWRAARAAVRRRRLQTIVIGVVVALSTTMIVVALGLLDASSGPFDRAYAQQRGAHLTVTYDPDSALRPAPQVAAAAGPFGVVSLDLTIVADFPSIPLTVAGRGDPGGEVDRLNVWRGRWVRAPGEIVLGESPVGPTDALLGDRVTASGGRTFTVVGFAYSVSESAGAWVTPGQVADLHPAAAQMLYRLTAATTGAQIDAARSAVTAGLPPGALLGATSYLALREAAAAEAGTFVPFLVVFGLLGLAVAVLIVANVISGTVVAGIRHIGVLKALGFTPAQVMAVYLTMVSVPALAGCLLGTVLGNVFATSLLTSAVQNYGAERIGVAPWVDVAALIGMPMVAALSAFVPALRARRLSATEAISAGAAQRTGRARWIQRRLGGTRLPRSVSLGLGLPFARPARSALTTAAVALGVTSATLAIGLAGSLASYERAQNRSGAVQVEAHGDRPALSDTADEALLRSLPGAAEVTASTDLDVQQVGGDGSFRIRFYRGAGAPLGYETLTGHWPDGPGQVAVSERFLRRRGLAVGDSLTLAERGRQTQVRIVGRILLNTDELIVSNWPTLDRFAGGARATTYEIRLRPGADVGDYVAGLEAGDPGLHASRPDDSDSLIAIILATVSLLTLMLGAVAALGVLNTVVLNTHERRRDVGMLKSIGMTPRQVVTMVVTSMAALGALGGLLGIPIGILAHRLVLPAMAHAAQVAFPARMLHVYSAPTVGLLALAGIGIAALGALLPARSAARATIAEVLHTE